MPAGTAAWNDALLLVEADGMTKKELKRMSRVELLELLLDIDEENERLRRGNV